MNNTGRDEALGLEYKVGGTLVVPALASGTWCNRRI